MAGHEKQEQILNRYLWHHFSSRPGNGRTVFNKEYLTIGDMWVSDAIDSGRGISIQEAHRKDLSDVQLDREGYVHTHQHISHAHEHGWPFPLWTQAADHPYRLVGKTAGWHFQDEGPGWIWDYMRGWKLPRYYGAYAASKWELANVRSLGVSQGKWQLESTGESPAIISPAGMGIEAFQSPFLQLRWTRSGKPSDHILPYVEWLREGDTEFSEDRRVYFDMPGEEQEQITKVRHSLIEMYRHPKWIGKIKRIRLSLAPSESGVSFGIDSFFTVYDTRHCINNPIFIFACWNYFRWTGNIDFLRDNINRMRTALIHQQTVMGGLKQNHIRNTWPGHDGLAGWTTNPDGTKTMHGGHGIGNNYFDILPFGWDDMYATSQYYAATMIMAELEEAISANPGWGVPQGTLALDPVVLRKHASEVKKTANRKFWDGEKGRFIGCIDSSGITHDYGFTFLNLDAVWYGIAGDEHARRIMDWISGKRTVNGDTSTGEDIYHWRFGPRCTTRRNIDWYGQCWPYPEKIPWGGQVQDGGAVLGFSFYDLWARLRVYGPDDAWERLCEILEWEEEVWSEGGYREYYKDGRQGAALQGGGTAGGLGIDCEFYESILIPSIVTYGFLGLDPGASELVIRPSLPSRCPEIEASSILYHNAMIDIRAGTEYISIRLKTKPVAPIHIALQGKWRLSDTGRSSSRFELVETGLYEFTKD